jgi:hypothetical protein
MGQSSSPRYKHDCDECQFAGRGGGRDLYVHVHDWGVELVARYGDNGPEYESRSLLFPRESEHDS